MQQDSTDGATTTSKAREDMRADESKRTVANLPADATDPANRTTPAMRRVRRFDWQAVSVVVISGAIFAALAHLRAQPYTSLVPAAVLSATGCG